MRKVLCIFFIVYVQFLFSQLINEITSFTYNREVVDYGDYQSAIVGYEDRVFIFSNLHFEECRVLPNGELVQLASFDIGIYTECEPVIDEEEETFYCIYSDGNYASIYLMKFDLSTTPMRHIDTVPIIVTPWKLYLWGDYLIFETIIGYLPDTQIIINRLNKHTLLLEEQINTNGHPIGDNNGPAAVCCMKDNYAFTQRFDGIENDRVLHIYDVNLENPFSESVYQFNLGATYYNTTANMRIVDNKLYYIGIDYIGVYDITDLSNITKITSASTGLQDTYLYQDAILYADTYLIGTYQKYGGGSGVNIYDISDAQHPYLVYTESIDYSVHGKVSYIYQDYLYVASWYNISIYNLLNNFEKSKYGNYRHDYRLVDEYIIENPRHSNEVKIYSLLEDEPETITIVNNELEADVYIVRYFQIIGNRLFAITEKNIGIQHFDSCLDMYEINNGITRLIDSFALGDDFIPRFIRVINEYILLSTSYETRVYQYTDGNLLYLSEFSGRVESPSGYTSQQYLLNYTTNGQIEFRDVNNPLFILDTAMVPNNINYTFLQNISDNTIYMYSFNNSTGYFFTFDEQHLVTSTYNTSPVSSLTIYNGIASLVDPTNFSTITFAAIENGISQVIGEETFNFVWPSIYIFPNHAKMILESYSGIHIYDIEVRLSDVDSVEKPLGVVLHPNYPNPFNPSTTISFDVRKSADVRIDIYNIKGQKVRDLVNGFYNAGKHSVVWNGLDDTGIDVSSGVYFYRIRVEEFVVTRKMVMVK